MKIVHRVHKKDNKSNEKVNYISKINETVSLKLQCKMVASDKTSSKIQKNLFLPSADTAAAAAAVSADGRNGFFV